MRVAILTNFLPAPANWGVALRVYHLARGLARAGRVSLYCRTSEEEAEKHTGHEHLRPYAEVHTHRLPRQAYTNVFRIFTDASMAVWMSPDDPLAHRLVEDHRREPYDVLVCGQLFTVNVARALAGVPYVLDATDIMSQAAAQMVAAMPRADLEAEQRRIEAIAAYEQKALADAALVTCVSEADAAQVRGQCATPVVQVPNGVAVRELPFTPPSQRGGHEVLFVGGFFWPPNIKAARFLAQEVLPRVWQEEPAARLVLCGRSPGIEVALLQRRGIEVAGTVPSVRPYLDRAAVYALALFEGAGSSLKVLEPLACGIPLVSTAVGARGFPLVAGRHYVAAEDAEGFVRAVLTLFRERASWDGPARAGRLLAEQFDWERIADEFAAAVAGVALRGGAPLPS
jgi:glycosyltransferase involved in cell wall biosynthesis